jgi:MFS family permease
MQTLDPGAGVRTEPAASSRRYPRQPAFLLVGLSVLAVLSAAGAPSPLYVVHQQRWGFSDGTLTAVFAVYAVALLAALVTIGGISDFVGRRPVLVVALALEAVSMGAFLFADGVPVLVLARVLQGLATGALTGVASATLVDLQPPGSQLGAVVNSACSTAGLAVGAIGSGLLVQHAPAPTTLVYVVLPAVFVGLAVALLALPETVAGRPGAWRSLRPQLAVPPQARRAFVEVLPILVATWSTGGLYLSLGPSIAVRVLGLTSHVAGALVVTVLTGAGAVTAVLVRDGQPRGVMLAGSAALAAGATVTVVGVEAGSPLVFFLGTAVAGVGFGAGFLGAFRTLAELAEPGQRAELLASVFVVNYLSFSVPAVVAGLLAPVLGLAETATANGVVVIVLSLVVLLGAGVRRAARARA